MIEQALSLYWKTVVDTIQEGVMIVDQEGAIVSVNRALERITGYSREGILGQPCSILNCSTCKHVRDKRGGKWCLVFEFGRVNRRRCVLSERRGITSGC